MCREWRTLGRSVLNVMSPSNPSPQGSENYSEERGKPIRHYSLIVGTDDTEAFQTQQGCHTWDLTETMTARTGHAQVKARRGLSAERGTWRRSSHPNQDAVSDWQLLARENELSPVESHRVMTTHVRAGPIPSWKWPLSDELNGILEAFVWSHNAWFEHF